MDSEPAMSSPRSTLVCKAERWVKGHPNRPIHAADVCAAFNIPLRTFQRIFHETVGMGPAHYFAAMRLNQARAALLAGSPFTTSVTQIALDHGFIELGRFAGAYRRTFGETPSETLHGGHNELAAARVMSRRHSNTKRKERMKEGHEPRLKEQPCRADLGLANGAGCLDINDDAELHVDEIVVGIGEECRPLVGAGPLGRRIGRRHEVRDKQGKSVTRSDRAARGSRQRPPHGVERD
jgi:AraC-like DNA-binding protein